MPVVVKVKVELFESCSVIAVKGRGRLALFVDRHGLTLILLRNDKAVIAFFLVDEYVCCWDVVYGTFTLGLFCVFMSVEEVNYACRFN